MANTGRFARPPGAGAPVAAVAAPQPATYRNPVLFADYSDPDAIRVGEDYWLTASSFSHVPGLPILHSRDLVNWTLVNYALPALVPMEHFAAPRHGAGVWAPALRYHAGKYWLYYPDPDFGLYVITSDDPRHAWSAPQMVKAGKGLIDPCPFWDDDGTGYLVHGWAKSRAGIKNRVTLHRLSADNSGVADAGEVIIDGDEIEGWHTIEGPKLYKRAGYYYVFAPAGGVRDGYQSVFRSRRLHGPYEHRIVLAQGRTAVNGPHQGAWVDTPRGEHWFLHFQELPAFGRIVHLQPVTWRDDWPQMGQNVDAQGVGEPVSVWSAPHAVAPAREPAPVDGPHLPALPTLDWQWQANPQPGWFKSEAGGARWRLAAVPFAPARTLWDAPNLLLRKFQGPGFSLEATLRLAGAAEGDEAGMIVFGHDYAWLGLRRSAGGLRVVLVSCANAHQGGAEREVEAAAAAGDTIAVRLDVGSDAMCQFLVGADPRSLRRIGQPFEAKSSYWVGAKAGFFARATAPASDAFAEISNVSFRITAPETGHNGT